MISVRTFAVPVLTLAIVTLAGCAANDPYQRTKAGAAIGAVAGAVIGSQTDSKSGALAGALLGALAGGSVGYYMDNQQREFERALEDERRNHALEIERLKDDTLKLSLNSEVSFDFNRDDIKSAFRPTLDKLGTVINKYDRTVVHIVGHTDSVGSDAYNMDLSERRAGSVLRYLSDQRVPVSRLRSEGRGEREPRDTNETEAGRQLNRRVEIFIKPVVEGQEQRAYDSPYRGRT
jgi:outer membrane protein OmpA-like peptidoglycan-associated protein